MSNDLTTWITAQGDKNKSPAINVGENDRLGIASPEEFRESYLQQPGAAEKLEKFDVFERTVKLAHDVMEATVNSLKESRDLALGGASMEGWPRLPKQEEAAVSAASAKTRSSAVKSR